MSIEESWHEEKQSAWLYQHVANAEPNTERAELFKKLGSAALSQAIYWENAAEQQQITLPEFKPQLRAHIVTSLLKIFSPRTLRPILAAIKIRGLSVYDHQPTSSATNLSHSMPISVEEIGRRHQGPAGGNLRAAVFGVSDGLVSNASLIMGVAAANASSSNIMLTGIAGLLAGALSMAAGEFISVRSQREMFEYQIALERDELNNYPEEEAEELALIYAARGMDIDNARTITHALVKNPDQALNALAREELGLNPDDLGSAWGAASSSFVAFALGACLPLLPFLFSFTGQIAIFSAAILSGFGLFGVGTVLSLFTGKNALGGGLRMLTIGGGAGLVSWLIGSWLGTALA